MKWCTECEAEERQLCEEKHRSALKEVVSITLSEEDRAVALLYIEREQPLPWRLALKLYEKMKDAEAGESAMSDDRDAAEAREERWEKLGAALVGDTGAMSPEQVVEAIREKLLREAGVARREGGIDL